MGFVEKQGDDYLLTSEGWQFVEVAVEDWADTGGHQQRLDRNCPSARTKRQPMLGRLIRNSVRRLFHVIIERARFPAWIIRDC